MKNKEEILNIVRRALKEDIGKGDITTDSLILPDLKVKAIILAKEDGILSGLNIAKICFKLMDKSIKFIPEIKDGQRMRRGQVIARLEGRACKILNAERTALNFLMHLSGISTLTRRFLEKVKPYKVKITDTRKTIPGLRILEKYAVRVGGGKNHRMGLYDQVLIKENHITVYSLQFTVYSLKEMIEKIKKKVSKNIKIEIEVKNLKEFNEALEAKPDIIMLDNMNLKDIRKAVRIRNQKPETRLRPTHHPFSLSKPLRPTHPSDFVGLIPELEVSGNVNLKNVRKLAETGVDTISIGALTHSAKAIDISLEILK